MKTKLASTNGLTRFAMAPRTEPSSRHDAGLPANHPAIVNGTTMFPSRVFEPRERGRVLISGHNNAKIGNQVTKGQWAGFPIYTLSLEERATCPRSCAVWSECYGNAMPAAVRFRYGPELIRALDAELRELATDHPAGFVVRLHVLGDFPDAQYVGWWSHLMTKVPQIHVWGYTAHAPDTEIGGAIMAMNAHWSGRWRFARPSRRRRPSNRCRRLLPGTLPAGPTRPADWSALRRLAGRRRAGPAACAGRRRRLAPGLSSSDTARPLHAVHARRTRPLCPM